MPFNDLDYEELTNILIDNFKILASEVQLLGDQRTWLLHKCQYAHEQYQQLADKYAATSDPEISSIIAKLQLPPDISAAATTSVPLPHRQRTSRHHSLQIAIRDGRRAVKQLTGAFTGSTTSHSISGGSSNMRLSAHRTSLSTVLETDFTEKGIPSSLECPFSTMAPNKDPTKITNTSQGGSTFDSDPPLTPSDAKDPTPHHSGDPICAAMYAETMSSAPPSVSTSANKCPIRYLDQHSPEEVARYFETHKHEIPRSHEVCVKRYQRNEDDIKKLDAKYGSLVQMIQGLGGLHQPMLPTKEEEEFLDQERVSIERVESWANNVSADGIEPEHKPSVSGEDDRESRFDRPLKEVRVGESPSRPWGISVPIFDQPGSQVPSSPPPAPVSITPQYMPQSSGKCPFGHMADTKVEASPDPPKVEAPRASGRCPFGNSQNAAETSHNEQPAVVNSSPVFIQPDNVPKNGAGVGGPQFLFTGPVFIGYPMDQAITFMNQYQRQN